MGTDDMMPQILNPEYIDRTWNDIAPFLQEAVDESAGELELGFLKRRLEDTTAIALCITEENTLVAVSVLERITYPSSKTVLGIICLGGTSMEGWVDVLDEAIAKIAEEQDCHEIRIVGRPGWAKVLKRLGWEQTHVILSKRG